MNTILALAPTVTLLAVLGMLFSAYRGDGPAWSLDFKSFSTKLKGYWTPLFLLVAPVAFVYNVIATAVYALMVLCEWGVSLVRWLIGIILWIWNKGFLWYWRNVIVVPVVLIARSFWHYVVIWPWRIYKTAYFSIKDSVSREGMRVGAMTMTLVAACVGLGYWLGHVSGMELFLFLGILLAEVPYLWGMGVLASMWDTGDLSGDRREVHRAVGLSTARMGMKYVGAAAGCLVVIFLVSFSGVIPDAGYVVLGLFINAAHAASLLGIGVCLVLFLSLTVLPTYVLDGHDESPIEEMLSLIRMGRDNILKMVVGIIPASLFGFIVALIPVALVMGTFTGAMFLKDLTMASALQDAAAKEVEIDAVIADPSAELAQWSTAIKAKPDMERQLAQLGYLQDFPVNLIDDPEGALAGVQTVDYSAMQKEMETAFAERQSMRNMRIGELEGMMAELQEAIQLEREERSTYTVERSADGGESWSVVAEGIERAGYVDSGLSSGEKYQYRVTANNRKGSSGPGNVSTGFTRSAEIEGPTGMTARTEGNFRIVLSWNDNDWNEEGFRLERSNDGEEWSQVARLDANSTFFVDESVTDTTYRYRVFSYRGEDESEPSMTYRSVQPYLAAPRSKVSDVNSSSALVVWSHDADYRRANRGGSTIDGDGGPLSFNGMSRLEELEAQYAEFSRERDDLVSDGEADAANTMPRVDLLSSLPMEEDASSGMRLVTFLLGILAMALLAGLGLSTLMSYTSGLNQRLVRLTDGGEYFFVEQVRAARAENENQPLLGFLLLGLTGGPFAALVSAVLTYALSVVMAFLLLLGLPALPNSLWAFDMPEFEISADLDWSFDDVEDGHADTDFPDETNSGAVSNDGGTYTMQGGYASVWREITTQFGENGYAAIRELNSDLTDSEWKALSAGDVIKVPEEN